MTRMRRTRKEHGIFGGKREFRSPREGKGKAIPLQVRTGPEGSRKLRLLDF